MRIVQKEHTLILSETPWRLWLMGGAGILLPCIIFIRVSGAPFFANSPWWLRAFIFLILCLWVANGYTSLGVDADGFEINTLDGTCKFIDIAWFGKKEVLEEYRLEDLKLFEVKEDELYKKTSGFYIEMIMKDGNAVALPLSSFPQRADCEDIIYKINTFLRSAGWLSGAM